MKLLKPAQRTRNQSSRPPQESSKSPRATSRQEDQRAYSLLLTQNGVTPSVIVLGGTTGQFVPINLVDLECIKNLALPSIDEFYDPVSDGADGSVSDTLLPRLCRTLFHATVDTGRSFKPRVKPDSSTGRLSPGTSCHSNLLTPPLTRPAPEILQDIIRCLTAWSQSLNIVTNAGDTVPC